ncbi:SDR family NAD(P)-dependent oxidoreductase [Virgibacillus salinus]|uniref:3-oxoacyl-[acyl-carrier protein] reductase n=1 Tax=Virgibacillus salinus TaxID=553311 RepID=A0A1H0YNC9_9BACI|nr:3-oxoacyl-ACP reductase FabG [Virgibacillus salinus]SDQ16608.1 3-oxoacyl-[acyl-carrier protein] reductase [Virgibacillus salinus]
MFTFENQVVWVTGSSTGIGRSIALAFAGHGAKVVVHGNSNIEKAEQVLNTIRAKGNKALLVKGDVTDRDQVESMVSEIKAHFDRIDVLINNAGTMVKRSEIASIDMESWKKIFDINVNSVLNVTQSVLPIMKEQRKGRIINITSIAARNGGGGGAVAYASAKAAVSTFTRGLAKEVVDDNIYVNGIAPGIIRTPFHDKYSTKEMREKMASQVPMKREGEPEEIAGAAMYLASNYANYITGEIIEVNGGLLMD